MTERETSETQKKKNATSPPPARSFAGANPGREAVFSPIPRGHLPKRGSLRFFFERDESCKAVCGRLVDWTPKRYRLSRKTASEHHENPRYCGGNERRKEKTEKTMAVCHRSCNIHTLAGLSLERKIHSTHALERKKTTLQTTGPTSDYY